MEGNRIDGTSLNKSGTYATGDTTELDRKSEHSSRTHYNEFAHPNLEQENTEEIQGCMAVYDRFDDKYIRPFLVYKYDRLKLRPEFELEQVLDEYKMIEEELNEESVDDIDMSRAIPADGSMSIAPSARMSNRSKKPGLL